MIKALRQKCTKGFTLIELLVVIAIIGILAALLFPGIQAALVRARAVSTGNSAKQFHLGLFDKTLFGESTWPDDSHGTSTEYFKAALTNRVVKGVDFTMFSGPGMPSYQKLDEFEADGNMWCITVGLREDSPDSVPFMFSNNINLGATLADLNVGDPLLDVPPFGKKIAVVVYKGSQLRVFSPDELTQEAFNPPDPVDPADTRDFEYLKPE